MKTDYHSLTLKDFYVAKNLIPYFQLSTKPFGAWNREL